MGFGAFLIYLNPQRNLDLLKTGIVGKGLYAFFTYYFFIFHKLHWFFLIFGVWDFVFVIVFFLYLIQLESPDLAELQRGDIYAGLDRKRTGEALLIGYSFTGNGSKVLARIQKGLLAQGYTRVDIQYVEPLEKIFRPATTPTGPRLGFLAFWRIVLRAAFRVPATISPLVLDRSRDYDLVVVEAQTHLLGMSAPVEAIFTQAGVRDLLANRDAAAVVVCRGAYRRSLAQVVRWLQSCRANVVGGRGYVHAGWEPSRLLSLWAYLIFGQAGRPRWLSGLIQKHYGPSEQSLDAAEHYGEDLARRRPQVAVTDLAREATPT
jgi:hypothetical protein